MSLAPIYNYPLQTPLLYVSLVRLSSCHVASPVEPPPLLEGPTSSHCTNQHGHLNVPSDSTLALSQPCQTNTLACPHQYTTARRRSHRILPNSVFRVTIHTHKHDHLYTHAHTNMYASTHFAAGRKMYKLKILEHSPTMHPLQ